MIQLVSKSVVIPQYMTISIFPKYPKYFINIVLIKTLSN